MILPNLGIAFHSALDWSDTQPVPAEKLPSRDPSLDQMVGGDPVAPKNADLRLSGGGDVDPMGQLFHMEQLGGDGDVSAEVDRVSALVGELAGGAGGFDPGMESEVDLDLRARYFAHEVNGLVAGISGRAQRAVISGDLDQARVAMKMAADVGIRVASLCEFFMSRPGGSGGVEAGDIKSDNRDLAGGRSGLDGMQVLAVHRDAVELVGVAVGEKVDEVVVVDGGEGGETCCVVGGHGEHGGIRFAVDLGAGGVGGLVRGVPLPGILLERVLVNLYANALEAMGGVNDCGAGDEDGGGRLIRLRGRVVGASRGVCPVGGGCGPCPGDCVIPGYVSLVVEDSGPGIGVGDRLGSGSGCGFGTSHGLGLGVCKFVCEQWGGEFLVGASDVDDDGLGGLRVEMRFGGRKLGFARGVGA